MLPSDVMQSARRFHMEFRSRLNPGDRTAQPCSGGVLKVMQECDAELLRFAFGELGSRMHKFVQALDLDHPEAACIRDAIFGGDTFFSVKFVEFMRIADKAHADGLSACFPFLGQSLVNEYMNQGARKKIEAGHLARSFVRVVKDLGDREALRKSKSTQSIDLCALWKKGDDLWSSLPSDFGKFIRFDSAYEDELCQAKRRMDRYQEMGCTTLAKEMECTINAFRESMQQSYYGFNRVTMTNAAVILAKFHGYSFSSDARGTFASGKIDVSQGMLGDYVFCVEPSGNDRSYTYQPKVYCFHALSDLASPEIHSVVSTLESFPEAGGKPIFDHYGVIVPSLLYNGLCLRDPAGFIHKASDQQEASILPDRSLIKTNSVVPILVGERDNKCYFITYWV